MICTLYAKAKVNLDLHITSTLPNGYHELDSLFWPLKAPADELQIRTSKTTGITLTVAEHNLDPLHNTLTKAYALFASATGEAPNIDILLKKNIPMGGGLGGGSSDAATLLKWLNTHSSVPLSKEKLKNIALQVGADVPFFLLDRPAHVLGVGEKIYPLENNFLNGYTLLLVCPPIQVSTAWAYRQWDEKNIPAANDKCLTKAISEAKKTRLTDFDFSNDFEQVIFPAYPQLAEIKSKLIEFGAEFALMSGSGACMCGLFQKEESAQAAFSFLRKEIKMLFIQHL